MSLPLVCPYFTDPVHFFDDKTRKPCIGQCGHTVCLQCITDRRFSRCPDCGFKKAFSKVSVNYTAIALIEECRKRFWEKWREWVDRKNRSAGFCSKLLEEIQLLCSMCVKSVEIPRICLTCEKETLFKLNCWDWKQNNAIVLKLLKRVMCSNCAIDNHGEKGHEIVNHKMNKKSKKLVTMAIAQKVMDMFKDAIEDKKDVIDCFVRRLKIEIIGQNLLKLFEELEYLEEWECGYLGELVKRELIKKYMENVDEKMLDLFGTEGNVCDCSRYHEEREKFSRRLVDAEKHRVVGIKPQVFESECSLYSWRYIAEVLGVFSGVAATIPPSEINCPLCVYRGYSQHHKKDFLLEFGVSIIGEFCKTELIPLDKCCLNCLDILNDCQFLFSCEHQKKKQQSCKKFTDWYREKERSKNQKRCYQNCFMKNSTLWNFVIINHMMGGNNLYEVITHEIEQKAGFFDCQLRKVRIKQTLLELYNGLKSVYLWDCFDYWSKPIEMEALFESFKQQWYFFRNENREQTVASQCKCTVIWNKISKDKMMREKYEDLEIKMIDMARYSMTKEIPGCPMEYNHGIELNMDDMEELDDAVCFETTSQESKLNLVGDGVFQFLMKKLGSNIFPFAHLHCQNEEEQLFDNKVHQPYSGTCEHTICSQCVEKTHNGDCPVCGKEGSFGGHQLNEELIQEIATIKENAWEIFKEYWNSEAADSGACSKCNRSSSDLYVCHILNLIVMKYTKGRLSVKTTADVLKLSRQVLCEECASVQANAMERVNSISFWKNHLKKTNGRFLLELLEDEDENCKSRQIDIQENRKQLIKVLGELNYEEKQECGYERELIKLKLIGKLIEDIDQSKKQMSMPEKNNYEPIKEKNCPMCTMIDFLDCAKNESEHNRNNWMNVFKHLWTIQSSRFEKYCTRCLLYLKTRYSALCQTETENDNIKKMGTAINNGIGESQLDKFDWILYTTSCKDCELLVDDEEIWQNLIIREYLFCLLQTITKGLPKTTFACHLRKHRIYNLAYLFLSEVCDVWHMNNQNWIVYWRFLETSSMLENLNLQFKKLRDKMDKAEFGIKCKCTDIWERSQIIMKKIGHEDCEEKRKLQYLEDSMEEMARFSLEEDLDGCPMEHNHGIELDGELVRKLKEETDLEAETHKNKCLCDVIDSFAPISKISDANLNHIVSFFINWWQYEALYPHLICHVCVERLELIQKKLKALSGFFNLYLRNSILILFKQLTNDIQGFQMKKGRIFEHSMELMTVAFDEFIYQWNLFRFGSESDQHFLMAETVCYCTEIRDIDRLHTPMRFLAAQNKRYYNHRPPKKHELRMIESVQNSVTRRLYSIQRGYIISSDKSYKKAEERNEH